MASSTRPYPTCLFTHVEKQAKYTYIFNNLANRMPSVQNYCNLTMIHFDITLNKALIYFKNVQHYP